MYESQIILINAFVEKAKSSYLSMPVTYGHSNLQENGRI